MERNEFMRAVLFDKYSLPLLPELVYYADGQPGQRVLFMSDPDETFVIAFEEGMHCMDLLDSKIPYLRFEYQNGNRYLNQVRTDPETCPGTGNYAFFHMEVPDEKGNIHTLPGQMTSPGTYQWSPGVEPVLIRLLNGLTVCNADGEEQK